MKLAVGRGAVRPRVGLITLARVALSRRKHGFESRWAHQGFQGLSSDLPDVAHKGVWRAAAALQARPDLQEIARSSEPTNAPLAPTAGGAKSREEAPQREACAG